MVWSSSIGVKIDHISNEIDPWWIPDGVGSDPVNDGCLDHRDVERVPVDVM